MEAGSHNFRPPPRHSSGLRTSPLQLTFGRPQPPEPMREDQRTLAEFYPDPTTRHRAHSGFVHQFLPAYVCQNPWAFFHGVFGPDKSGNGTGPLRFIQSRWMMFEEMAQLIVPQPLNQMVF